VFKTLTLALLFLSVGARAADAQTANRWLVLAQGEPTVELDTTTVTKGADGFPRVWLRITFTTPRGAADKQYVSMKWRVDFNCKKRQDKIVELIQYAASGDVVADEASSFAAWTEVAPETVGEGALNGFCASKFAH
jgi:hypothetical protein